MTKYIHPEETLNIYYRTTKDGIQDIVTIEDEEDNDVTSALDNLQNVQMIQWSPDEDDHLDKTFELHIRGNKTQKIKFTDAPKIIKDNMTYYWPLNENTDEKINSKLIDLSVSISGESNWIELDEKNNKYLSFNSTGLGRMFETNSKLKADTEKFTIAGWKYFKDGGDWVDVFEIPDDEGSDLWELERDGSSENLRIEHKNDTILTFNLTYNKWIFFGITVSGRNVEIHLWDLNEKKNSISGTVSRTPTSNKRYLRGPSYEGHCTKWMYSEKNSLTESELEKIWKETKW